MYDFQTPKQLQTHCRSHLNCIRCAIASRHKVFYRGSIPCKYLLIGEAPGPSETVTHLPFTGTAGRMLNRLLDEVEMTNYGITNMIACFPSHPENKAKFRKPTKEEIANCNDRLMDLVETVEAQYYIALGKVAAGNPPEGCEYALALDHPSYLVRRGGEKSVEYKRNRHKLKKFLKETI